MPISNARRNYVLGMLVTLYFPNFVDRRIVMRAGGPRTLDGQSPLVSSPT